MLPSIEYVKPIANLDQFECHVKSISKKTHQWRETLDPLGKKPSQTRSLKADLESSSSIQMNSIEI